MLPRGLGLVLLFGGIIHIVYMFYSSKRSILRWIGILAVLFGAALWQYPEKTNEIIGQITGKIGI